MRRDSGLGVRYLGELVQAQDLSAVVLAVPTLIHQLLEEAGDLVFREGKHDEGEEAAHGGSWRRERRSRAMVKLQEVL